MHGQQSAVQDMLKEILYREGKWKQTDTQIHSGRNEEHSK